MGKRDWYDIWHEEGKIEVPENHKIYLELMLYDLQEGGQEMKKDKSNRQLAPSTNEERYESNGCEIRTTKSTNPKWYSELCNMHLKPEYKTARKNKGKYVKEEKYKRKCKELRQTNLKKSDIIRIIGILINKKVSKSQHAPYLLEVAESYIGIFKDYDEQQLKQKNPFLGELEETVEEIELIPFNNQF